MEPRPKKLLPFFFIVFIVFMASAVVYSYVTALTRFDASVVVESAYSNFNPGG